MKKIFVILIVVLIIVISTLMIFVTNYKEQVGQIKEFNLQFEKYEGKIIQGIEVASLINNAVDSNEKNEISKNENGIYQDNDKNCIRIEIIMQSVVDESNAITYAMEDIYSLGMDRFVKNFNLMEFKCNKITYNSIGRVNKIVFELQ